MHRAPWMFPGKEKSGAHEDEREEAAPEHLLEGLSVLDVARDDAGRAPEQRRRDHERDRAAACHARRSAGNRHRPITMRTLPRTSIYALTTAVPPGSEGCSSLACGECGWLDG
jgi:hypothetical protein